MGSPNAPLGKDQVHGAYLERMKAEHADKRLPSSRHILIVGSNGTDNIGWGIERVLSRVVTYHIEAPPIEMLNAAIEGDWEQYFEEEIPDTLILCCGETSMDWIENFDDQRMVDLLENNLLAPMVATSQFVKASIDKPHRKQIVYIGSMAYRNVLNASSIYCAAKAGLAHFVRCMGWELTPKGYDVFCVHPSNTEGTPMTRKTISEIAKYREISPDEAEDYWGSINLTNHWLQITEIGEIVKFLLSGHACHMTGTQIELSGGQR